MSQAAVPQGALSNPISRGALGDRLKLPLLMIPGKAKSLLDMGCGEGHFLAAVERTHHSIRLVGVDLSDENIRYARKILSRAKLICGDASRIDIPSSSFEVISALELLDHVEDEDALLSEASRLLKPQGILVLSIPDSSMLTWRLGWGLWTATVGRRWREKHLREYNEAKIEEMLERNGFRIRSRGRAIFGCVMIFACEKI
ncbi:MAG: class I SAM-dependent methyltransferase [Candidatus Micrarchaeota archaeon]|nr:class I SAM-dependent methyltransferase [Candidatus Micrarchaeota archaeon]